MFYTRLDVGFVLSHLLFLYVSYKKHAAFFLVNGNQLHSTQFKTPFFLNLWVNLIHGCSLIVGIVFDIVFIQACKRFWGPSDQEGRYLFFPVTSSNPNLVLEYFLSSLLLACFKQKFAFSVLYTDTLKIPIYGSINRERAMTLKVLICTTTRPIN